MIDATLAPAIELPTCLVAENNYAYHLSTSPLWNGVSSQFLALDGDSLSKTPQTHWNEGNSYTAAWTSYWNSAHNENARRSRESWVPTPTVPEDGADPEVILKGFQPLTHDERLAKLRGLILQGKELERERDEAVRRADEATSALIARGYELEELKNEQIKGDDSRLTDFWSEAQDLANEEGYCEVYDRMSSELGGPARMKMATVRITRTETYEVIMLVTEQEYQRDSLDQDMPDLEDCIDIEEEVVSIRWE